MSQNEETISEGIQEPHVPVEARLVTKFVDGKNAGTVMEGNMDSVDGLHLVGSGLSTGIQILLQHIQMLQFQLDQLAEQHNRVAKITSKWFNEEHLLYVEGRVAEGVDEETAIAEHLTEYLLT